VFTGRFVAADEALQMGLVDEVVAPDEVYAAARTWASQFTRGATRALAAAKAETSRPSFITEATLLRAMRST